MLAAVLVAGLLFPLAGGFGFVSNRAADAVDNVSAELVEGTVPAVSTMVDAAGNPIAWLYEQRRFEVPSEKISNDMKLAIVSIEDRRFADHDGVDWQGTLRAFLTNTTSGEVQQGASTIDQQYVKNFQLLVVAKTDAERRAAIETTPARKIREIRMALTLDKELTKDEILTRYLNLVPFGNSSYGIQDAAQTYFGIDAAELNVPQSAMLAGMVQSSSKLNPYTNPEGVLARRNTVLDTMIQNIPSRADEFRKAKTEPLGVLPEPKGLPRGCIAAGDRGFFCDYALQYLANAGISREQIEKGGYLIRTTLDPAVQDSVKRAVSEAAPPDLENIAEVMSVVAPGQDSHPVLAMASSRTYGLNREAHETLLAQPYSMVGDGAGSVFKLFTTAAAMEKGMGINAQLDVPGRFNAQGMGNGGAPGCPPATYCVENAGRYKSPMSVTEALATSPNTAFVKLIQAVGVTPTVDMAVRLGMRSYTEPGSSGLENNQSLADMIKSQNLGSFTLGPVPINPLELSNVAATLASGGKWCPPSPIKEVIDRSGKQVPLTQQACEQVVEPGLANTLANAMSKDDQPGGTAFAAAANAGWTLPMAGKTGTTESHRSSAFVGFTNSLAASVYVYGDSPTPGEICSFPLRNCGASDANGLFGGNEPARTWYNAIKPVVGNFPPPVLPPLDDKYVRGANNAQVPDVVGMKQGEATAALIAAGFKVTPVESSGSAPKGTVTGSSPNGSAIPGSLVTIYVSDGTVRTPPPPGPQGPPPGVPGLPPPPRLPPIPIPIPLPFPR
ncbi:penicillin-binding protein [Nocardia cyriacigeorgica]|uniref:penicillin-binding protein n=1 Tax=Nocardia cyriacigeorgica TaxID=135487 RepID=UPI0018955667|nr:penicillin-binding protein [Nocardia cyriacigeorgica]MBF6101997.1 penicillin-binding protein [Nocardia cyriacigeorgica]MBF6315215.1 penicillin-binding protein [Nocardia cyriacigeorgica]MBF6343229.1 penicillin-binding protein [Nocardia cyriacigeorgica]MBF6530001.1 penicillin-binding protein [Nocardia cyriacigeorgica]